MISPSQLTLMATHAALQAGALLARGFGTSFTFSSKTEGRQNLVTEFDYAAEKMIIDFLRVRTPGCAFLAEESGHTKGTSELLWIVDPLDGTVNFAHGIPFFCISIAAVWQNEIVTGVVYQPLLHELFTSTKGEGAFLNGQPIRTSQNRSPDQALVTTGFPTNVEDDPRGCIETFNQMLEKGFPIRRLGSAALDLAYIAAGRFDAFWEVKLSPWDFAAGCLLIEEAGGQVTDYEGNSLSPQDASTVLATNGALHPLMLEVLKQ